MNEPSSEQFKKKPSRRKYILAAGIVVLLVISALFFSLFQPKTEPDPASEALIRQEAARELEFEMGLEKDQNELTDEDFAAIKLLNIGGVSHPYIGGTIVDIKELKDIKILEKFTGLQSLHMLICFPQKDIPKWIKILAKWNVIDLTKRFTIDLTPLENLNNLERLDLVGLPIKDLEPISKLVNLRDFSLGVNQVSDLKPLKNLTNLECLRMIGSGISNLEPLRNLTNLEYLDITGTDVSNLEPLEGLGNLKQLYIVDCNKISDEQIEDLQKALPDLVIRRN